MWDVPATTGEKVLERAGALGPIESTCQKINGPVHSRSSSANFRHAPYFSLHGKYSILLRPVHLTNISSFTLLSHDLGAQKNLHICLDRPSTTSNKDHTHVWRLCMSTAPGPHFSNECEHVNGDPPSMHIVRNHIGLLHPTNRVIKTDPCGAVDGSTGTCNSLYYELGHLDEGLGNRLSPRRFRQNLISYLNSERKRALFKHSLYLMKEASTSGTRDKVCDLIFLIILSPIPSTERCLIKAVEGSRPPH